MPPAIATNLHHTIGGNNLNINLPENNAVLRLEVELRDKNARRRPNYRNKGHAGDRIRAASPANGAAHPTPPNPNHFFIPMEKVRSIFGLLFCTFMVIIDPLVLLLNLTLNTFASAKLPKALIPNEIPSSICCGGENEPHCVKFNLILLGQWQQMLFAHIPKNTLGTFE